MGWSLRLSDKTVRKLAELPIYCQRQKCSPGNVVSDGIRFIQIFAGVRWRGGVKWEWCSWKWRFSLHSFSFFRPFYVMATRQLSGDMTVNDLWHISRSLDCFTSNFSKTVCDTAKVSYYRQLIGDHTLAFDWCHFWWPWSTLYIWRSFQLMLSFPRPFQQSLACFRVARSPSNSWASCIYCTKGCWWRILIWANLQWRHSLGWCLPLSRLTNHQLQLLLACLQGFRPQTPTRVLPLYPAGGLLSPVPRFCPYPKQISGYMYTTREVRSSSLFFRPPNYVENVGTMHPRGESMWVSLCQFADLSPESR